MPMYNLIEYNDNYWKTLGSLWKYYRDEPALTDDGAIVNFHAADNNTLFRFKQKITGLTGYNGTKNNEIMISLKYLSHF